MSKQQVNEVSPASGSAVDAPGILSLVGKVAVVTGASSGIGRAIALAYARAIARPMPLDAPVTTATLPTSDRIPGASTALPDAGDTSFTCCFDIAPPNA